MQDNCYVDPNLGAEDSQRGRGLFEMMMARLREGKLFIPVIADDAVAPLASAFRANTDWDGVDHDVYVAFVRKLRISQRPNLSCFILVP